MKKMSVSCALITGLSLVFGFAPATILSVEAAPKGFSFQTLHQEVEEPAPDISDPKTFIEEFDREMRDPKNKTYQYIVLERRLGHYHQACQKFPGKGHYMMASFLLESYQANRLDAAAVPMVTAQFLKLGELPMNHPLDPRLLLLAAREMSDLKGPPMFDNNVRKRNVLLRAMYKIREMPGIDPALTKLASEAILKDYYSVNFDQALEELRKALKKALKILD